MTEFRASHRHARITGRKCRLSADLIRGMPVNRALEALQFTHRRSARFVEKVLKSALANAQQDADVDVNRLYVSTSRVDDGPLLGGRPRFRPGPRGRVMPLRKRTCHIHVSVTEAPQQVLGSKPLVTRVEGDAPAGEKSAKTKASAKGKAPAKSGKPAKANNPKGQG